MRNLEFVKRLLTMGANPNIANNVSWIANACNPTPLYIIACVHETSVLIRLVSEELLNGVGRYTRVNNFRVVHGYTILTPCAVPHAAFYLVMERYEPAFSMAYTMRKARTGISSLQTHSYIHLYHCTTCFSCKYHFYMHSGSACILRWNRLLGHVNKCMCVFYLPVVCCLLWVHVLCLLYSTYWSGVYNYIHRMERLLFW